MFHHLILIVALSCYTYGGIISEEVCNDDTNSFSGCMDLNERCNVEKTVNEDYRCIKRGCQCMTNYVYDDNQKKCVLPRECTPCNDDPNAYYGCAALNKHCNGKDYPFTEDYRCPEPGCQCVSNYMFDDTLNKCVPAEECTK